MHASAAEGGERFLALLGMTKVKMVANVERSCGNLAPREAFACSGFQRANAVGERSRGGIDSSFAGVFCRGFFDFGNERGADYRRVG
jgi:hypothetical protein